jgi:hypothetical protein
MNNNSFMSSFLSVIMYMWGFGMACKGSAVPHGQGRAFSGSILFQLGLIRQDLICLVGLGRSMVETSLQSLTRLC